MEGLERTRRWVTKEVSADDAGKGITLLREWELNEFESLFECNFFLEETRDEIGIEFLV
jgi:hypothetical protein